MIEWLHGSFSVWFTRALVAMFASDAGAALILAYEMFRRRRQSRVYEMLGPIFTAWGLLGLAYIWQFFHIPATLDLAKVPPLLWYRIGLHVCLTVLLWRFFLYVRGRIN
jgi:hypothetical protein